jgi:hypothetical protein
LFTEKEKAFVKKLRRLPVDERIELASRKVEGLWNYVIDVSQTHENNRIVVRSDRLSRQIPQSHAARAFKNLQRATLHHEIIRLAALWDGPAADRLSIPTIIAIVAERDVVRTLYKRRLLDRRAAEAHLGDDDGLDDDVRDLIRARAARNARSTVRRSFYRDAGEGLSLGIQVMNSARRKAVADFRHRNIAHNLSLDAVGLRAGQIDRLLHTTTIVANGLYGLIRSSGFAIDDSRDYARRCSESLWGRFDFGAIDY